MHFPVGALPEVQNLFLKQFSNKVLYNYCSNFFWSLAVSIWKSQKMDFLLYFKNVISKWHKVFWEIDHGCSKVFGPSFIGKSPCTTCKLTFEFWCIIVRPYPESKENILVQVLQRRGRRGWGIYPSKYCLLIQFKSDNKNPFRYWNIQSYGILKYLNSSI